MVTEDIPEIHWGFIPMFKIIEPEFPESRLNTARWSNSFESDKFHELQFGMPAKVLWALSLALYFV